ncbi:MAG: hypothetical protein LBT86_00835 [Deltaproteobacteria bacterium]|jgi:hypothetical protein|nr:hypothetical protein [Deltaproteobacteria bacterium]
MPASAANVGAEQEKFVSLIVVTARKPAARLLTFWSPGVDLIFVLLGSIDLNRVMEIFNATV